MSCCDDSLINLADYVAQRAGYELSKQEDNEYINGDGTSTYGSEAGLLSELGSCWRLHLRQWHRHLGRDHHE